MIFLKASRLISNVLNTKTGTLYLFRSRGLNFSTAVVSSHSTKNIFSENQYDQQQVTLLDEPCIVVDKQDKVLGSKSKKECHLFTNESKDGILHRAFSVFLFNSREELLLQRRSPAKITFPGRYTNSCCSHPLFTESEMEENNAIGVKIAAQRRLQIELGIPRNQLPLEKIEFITRIHYCAEADSPWGEHEMDYILIAQADVDVNVNLNEVSEHRYVKKQEFLTFLSSLERDGIPITPWFQLIVDHFLLKWWNNLSDLDYVKDVRTIHQF